jgi:hypothetical protein
MTSVQLSITCCHFAQSLERRGGTVGLSLESREEAGLWEVRQESAAPLSGDSGTALRTHSN